jgi:MarR-like DNA-binding transcriptional regulator SgrR of sgrS sRNA
MAAAEAAARSLAWEEFHPRSPTVSPRGVGSFLEPPSKPAKDTRDAIRDAYAECDGERRRLQRERRLTQGQRPQSASADQRRERQRARERYRAITLDDREVEERRRDKETRLLHLGRTLLAQAEGKLATTHERTQAQRRTLLQAREHARHQALVDELEARAEQHGTDLFQRAVDSSLVRLLETREAVATRRLEPRRRRTANYLLVLTF